MPHESQRGEGKLLSSSCEINSKPYREDVDRSIERAKEQRRVLHVSSMVTVAQSPEDLYIYIYIYIYRSNTVCACEKKRHELLSQLPRRSSYLTPFEAVLFSPSLSLSLFSSPASIA